MALTGIVVFVSAIAALIGLQLFGTDPAGQEPGDAVAAKPGAGQQTRSSAGAPEELSREHAPQAADAPGDWPPPGESGHVEGRVVVVDARGKEHDGEDGELDLMIWTSRAGRHEKVAVERGRFAIDLEFGDELSVRGVMLRGRHAQASREKIPAAPAIEIRATWLTPTILRVVDFEFGLELTAITVVAAQNRIADNSSHPGTYEPWDVRVEGGRSPLELTPDPQQDGGARRQETLWVHSPGYAWGRLTIDHTNATERSIGLRRGGTLEVRIEGNPSKKKRTRSVSADGAHLPRLRLRHGGEGQPDLELEAEVRLDAPIVLDGIAPGDYTVAVELGNSSDSPLVLGSTRATVKAGETERVTVRVEPPTERAPVPLSGTFFVPPAWKKSRFTLQFEPIDVRGKTPDMQRSLSTSNMTGDPASPGFRHWDAGLLLPGRYTVKCTTLAMQWVVDTGPNDNRNVEIVVGPPVDVSVQVIEDGTGRSVEKTRVFWNAPRSEGVSGASLGRARWNRARKRFEFRAAAGKIEVQVLNKDYTTAGDSVFDVHPNNKDLVIRVRRAAGIVLFLKQGETAIPWNESTRNELAIEKVDGTGGKVGSGGSEVHGMYLKVAEPGTYRVTIPDQPGFEPVAPFEVYLATGTFTNHDVQLLPRR